MSKNLEKYGIQIVHRPKIKASKSLNLNGPEGKQIIESETEVTLLQHKKTFDKLAHM
jgi:hypothetical protein